MRDPIVLTLPDDVFDKRNAAAAATAQTVEQVIIDSLRTTYTPQP